MGLHSGFERECRGSSGEYFTVRVRRTGIAPLFPHSFYVYRWAWTWVRRLLRRDRSWTVAVVAGRMDLTSNRREPERFEVVPTFREAMEAVDRLSRDI